MQPKGLQGLPHYKNSLSSLNSWEPLYMNLFTAQLTPPADLNTDFTLEIEQLKSIGGISTESVADKVKQIYKGAIRSYAGGLGTQPGAIELSLEFEVNLNDTNSAFIYKKLRKWCDLVWNPLTGGMTLKKTYKAPQLIVSVHNKVGDVYRKYVFYDIFPVTALPNFDLNYADGGQIYTISGFNLICDYWDDISQE